MQFMINNYYKALALLLAREFFKDIVLNFTLLSGMDVIHVHCSCIDVYMQLEISMN